MNPIFKPGDEVVIVNHETGQVSPETFFISGVLVIEDEFAYIIEGLVGYPFPEEVLRFYEEDLIDYWQYEDAYYDDPRYAPEDFDIFDFPHVDIPREEIDRELREYREQRKQSQLVSLPKYHTTDEHLDLYNEMKELYEITKDEKYADYAKQIMDGLKSNNRVNLDVIIYDLKLPLRGNDE